MSEKTETTEKTTEETTSEQEQPKQEQQPNANGGGEQPGNEGVLQLTQERLNEMMAERVERASKTTTEKLLKGLGVDKLDDLKGMVQGYRKLQEEQMSELEKAQKRAEEAERAQQEALERATDRLIRAAFMTAGAELRVKHPLDAMALADLGAVTVDDAGNVNGIKEQVQQLIEDGRLPTTDRPQAPGTNAGAGGGTRPAERAPQLAPEELEVARKLGLTPEQYAAGKKEPARR